MWKTSESSSWKRLGRSAIRSAELKLGRLDVAKLAAAAGLEGEYRGRIDGDLQGRLQERLRLSGRMQRQRPFRGRAQCDASLHGDGVALGPRFRGPECVQIVRCEHAGQLMRVAVGVCELKLGRTPGGKLRTVRVPTPGLQGFDAQQN